MSKNKQSSHTGISTADLEETTLVKADLLKITLLNTFYLALVLVVFYTNGKSQYLESFFSKIFQW